MLTNSERNIIRCLFDGNIEDARRCAKEALQSDATEKNKKFVEEMLHKIDAHTLMELPANLKYLLKIEDETEFDTDRYLLRPAERKICNSICERHEVAEKLEKMNIRSPATALLYGESGVGKTTLAKYIAHSLGLPYVCIRFSELMDSHMGGTQNNLANIFNYIRNRPCVLVLDELDAIGAKRGQDGSAAGAELSHIVISLMQELDDNSSRTVVIATTNREDIIDPALARRLGQKYEIKKLDPGEAAELCKQYLDSLNISYVTSSIMNEFTIPVTQSSVIDRTVEGIIKYVQGKQPWFDLSSEKCVEK